MRHADALALLDRETARARKALWVERAVACALPVLGFGCAWAALAMAGAFEALGPLPEALLACAFWVGAIAGAVFAWRGFKPPSSEEGRARLAADSGLDDAAFDAIEDRPTSLDPLGLALWKRAQAEAQTKAVQARARGPRPDWARLDRFNLRFVLPIAVVGAMVLGAGAAADRLARAVAPDPGILAGDGPLALEAWATPADYTAAAAVSLADRVGQTVPTPPSITVTVRLTGPKGPPDLVFVHDKGRLTAPFTLAADGAYEAKLAIPGAGQLSIVRFHTRARWTLSPAPDTAPVIAFENQPPTAPPSRIPFSWTAKDDFGVVSVALRMTPVSPPPGLVGAAPIETPLPAPGGAPRDAQGSADLLIFEHPYAGMEVEARLVAKDALGQKGLSAPARLVLPEKRFSQPMALAAVEIRKAILHERRRYATLPLLAPLPMERAVEDGGWRMDEAGPALDRAPQAIRRAARMLDALTMEPDDIAFPDMGVYAGLRLARAALGNAETIEDTTKAADILWQVALHAEHGDGADARRALEMARQRLQDALRNGASQEELDELMAEMRQAMEEYLDALTAQAMAQGQEPQTQEDTESQNALEQGDLDQMLEQMRRLADAGDLNAAERLLQQLSQMLDNLNIQLGEGPGLNQSETRGTQAQQDQRAEGLSDAIGEQREIRGQTGQGEQGQNGQGQSQAQGQGEGQNQNQSQGQGVGQGAGQGAGQSREQLAARQGDLADEIARQRGQYREGSRSSEALDDAEQAMRESERALREGDSERAAAAQDEALRRLRQTMERLSQESQQARQGSQSGGRRDPLGRAVGEVGEGEETAVPEEMERQRAREILDELRQRAQDPRRPESEREYLRRLLDRFTGS